MGSTAVSERMESAINTSSDYKRFCFKWLSEGWTPIFEWCSIVQQIVVWYGSDSLTLIAIRNNRSGLYVPYPELRRSAAEFGIPSVRVWEPLQAPSMADLVAKIKLTPEIEGVVVWFENGEAYKIKTDWYIERSKALTANFSTHEKDLWRLILEGKIDDLGAALGAERVRKLDEFGARLMAALERTAQMLMGLVSPHQSLPKADFVKIIKGRDDLSKLVQSMALKVFDGSDALDIVKKTVLANTNTTTNLEKVRGFAEGLSVVL